MEEGNSEKNLKFSQSEHVLLEKQNLEKSLLSKPEGDNQEISDKMAIESSNINEDEYGSKMIAKKVEAKDEKSIDLVNEDIKETPQNTEKSERRDSGSPKPDKPLNDVEMAGVDLIGQVDGTFDQSKNKDSSEEKKIQSERIEINNLEELRQQLLNELFNSLNVSENIRDHKKINEIYQNLLAINQERYRLKDENDEKQLDCALGAVIGAFIGDALGSAIEFQRYISPEDLQRALSMNGGVFGNGPGQVTDDSELAMCLLNGINDSLPAWDANSVAAYYRRWIISQPFDIGMTTRQGFGSLPGAEYVNLSKVAKRDSSMYNQSSLSNGSFMRSSPLAVFCRHCQPDLIKWFVTDDASMTHSNSLIHQTETLYIICIAHLIQHPQDRDGALQKTKEFVDSKCGADAKKWFSDCFDPVKAMPGNPNMGFVKIAFDHSFRELTIENIDFYESMKRVLNLGGDTDTNAAIVGAMIGAYVGYKNLPQEWKDKVENYTYETRKGIKRPSDFLDQTKVKGLVERIFWGLPKI